jgi:hypothetical protein
MKGGPPPPPPRVDIPLEKLMGELNIISYKGGFCAN